MKLATILESEKGMCEARCACCGKLLFKFRKKEKKCIDNTKQSVIIVARCTRNNCKMDNEIVVTY